MNDAHQTYTDQLSDYLDGELDPRERAAVDAHLAGCADCRRVLDELRTVVEHATKLPVTPPATELWEGILTRIGASQTTPVLPFVRAPRRTFAFTLPQLAAAGIALMMMSGGLVYFARSGGQTVPATQIAHEGGDSTISPVSLADARYEDAVHDLERTLADGRGKLDPETVRVLEHNLTTIDNAIAQSRAALEADPGNVFLNSHLISARQRKLALLRRATALTTGS